MEIHSFQEDPKRSFCRGTTLFLLYKDKKKCFSAKWVWWWHCMKKKFLLNSLYKNFFVPSWTFKGICIFWFWIIFFIFLLKGNGNVFLLFMKSYDWSFFFKKVYPCMLYKGKILLFLWILFSFKKMVFKNFFIIFLTKKCSKYRMYLSFFIFFCITPLPNSAGGVEYSSLSPWETLGERAWRP